MKLKIDNYDRQEKINKLLIILSGAQIELENAK